jgi:NADH dehydrogenase
LHAFSASTSPGSWPGGSGVRIYLLKLPRVEKKVRVALDWTLDVFFTKDFVQYLHQRSTPVVVTPVTNSEIRPKLTDTDQLSMVH